MAKNKIKNKQYKCKRTKFLAILQETRSLLEAMEASDIDLEKFNIWVEDFKWFKEAVEEFDRSQTYFVENKLIELIREGNMKAIDTYLKYKELFNKIHQNDIKIEDNKLTINVIGGNKEDLENI